MKEDSLKNSVIVLLFCLFLVAPILTISWTGGEYSDAEKRKLAAAPDLFQNGTINFEEVKAIKPWLEDHIGLREDFVWLYGNMQMDVFHQSPSSIVHIGNDGWYFYSKEYNLDIAAGRYPLSEEELERILEHQLNIKEELERKGIGYIIVLPPSKVSIYPEYVRYGSGKVRITPADIIADYLEANSDLKVVRLKEVLLDAKEENLVYYKTDTHWNQFGAYMGYQELMRSLKKWDLITADPIRASFGGEESYIGGLAKSMPGYFGQSHRLDEKTENMDMPQLKAEKNSGTPRELALRQILAQEGIDDVKKPCAYYRNSAMNGPTVLTFGDSFLGDTASGGWIVNELLAESCKEVIYIWDYRIQKNIVDYIEPDIVIFEITERLARNIPYIENFS